MIFYDNMNALPSEISDYIYEFLPPLTLTTLNKGLHIEHRYCLRKHIPVLNYESYIRHVVRKDNNFVFFHLMRDNFSRWQNLKNYRYKNFTFDDYVDYIIYLSQEHESSKVNALMIEHQNKDGKKRHKNARVRSNTWSN